MSKNSEEQAFEKVLNLTDEDIKRFADSVSNDVSSTLAFVFGLLYLIDHPRENTLNFDHMIEVTPETERKENGHERI